jgi:glutamyl-tRNA synthetase
MQISHAFRGEEWLPSAPVHILLWQYLFGIENMPQWAHLPLILKPDGNGKLSKRDGERLGFPVFAMDWTDPRTNEKTIGFKERGFLPEAFINMLALLGWSSGTDKEIFTLPQLIELFSIERVNKGGAKFDYEKAKWFNHEWIKQSAAEHLLPYVENVLGNIINGFNKQYIQTVINLVKERCTFLTDFKEQANFFFETPTYTDVSAITQKWDDKKNNFFNELINAYQTVTDWAPTTLEQTFKEKAQELQLKPGELMLPFRIMLVGGKFGPTVFDIAALIGKEETTKRIKQVLSIIQA